MPPKLHAKASARLTRRERRREDEDLHGPPARLPALTDTFWHYVISRLYTRVHGSRPPPTRWGQVRSVSRRFLLTHLPTDHQPRNLGDHSTTLGSLGLLSHSSFSFYIPVQGRRTNMASRGCPFGHGGELDSQGVAPFREVREANGLRSLDAHTLSRMPGQGAGGGGQKHHPV